MIPRGRGAGHGTSTCDPTLPHNCLSLPERLRLSESGSSWVYGLLTRVQLPAVRASFIENSFDLLIQGATVLNTHAGASAFPRGQRCALVAPRIRRTCRSIAADQKTKGPADVLTPLP